MSRGGTGIYTELDLAWLAGFIDGEGCILLSCQKPNPKRRTVSKIWIMRVCVTNTRHDVLALIQSWFGGYIVHKRTDKAHYKDGWTWEVSGHKAKRLLNEVGPYLVLKRSQCEVALKYAKTLSYSGKGYGRNPLSEMVIMERQALVDEIRDLNRRGKLPACVN